MSGAIYQVDDNDNLRELSEEPYDAEKALQSFLAQHPKLLAGDQISSNDPRRFILVTREMGVASDASGANRWSLDHLYLDQSGVPTFGEVKRSQNSEIRRAIVGQMLDYAANAVVYWPEHLIRARFEKRCARDGLDPDQELTGFLEGNREIDEYWGRVAENLAEGRLRLLFVADEIPSELRRIIEFLNEQMKRTEVLGVEVKQYVGEGAKALVPRVVGQTVQSEDRKSEHNSEVWTEDRFFSVLNAKHDQKSVESAKKILSWAKKTASEVSWGKGKMDGSFTPVFDVGKKLFRPFTVYTWGLVQLQFGNFQNLAPFDSEANRLDLIDRLNAIEDVSIGLDKISRYPNIPLKRLTSTSAFTSFCQSIEWMVDEIAKSHDNQ